MLWCLAYSDEVCAGGWDRQLLIWSVVLLNPNEFRAYAVLVSLVFWRHCLDRDVQAHVQFLASSCQHSISLLPWLREVTLPLQIGVIVWFSP